MPQPVRPEDCDERVWLFTAEEIDVTPSRCDGVSSETELLILSRTAQFMQECCRHLMLPQLTIAVALKLFQRFFMLESMAAHKPPKIAASCLFLACKVQETRMSVKDIIYWTVKVRTRNTADFPDGQDIQEGALGFYDEKRAIIDNEREVLRVLNFDITCDHPYKHLWTLNELFLKPARAEAGLPDRRAVVQSAWNFINDSFRLYIHVRYDPRVIASSVLYLAATLHSYPLPDGTGKCPRSGDRLKGWHEYFHVDLEEIMEIGEQIMSLYEADRALPEMTGGYHTVSRDDDDRDPRKT